jgi:XTP/dITP diphosphohydrolase
MPPEAKYAISHRTRAFEAFKRDCLDHVKTRAPNAKSGRDLEALDAASRNLSTQAELAKFIASLREDYAANRLSWKAADLSAFLVALERAAATTDASDSEPRWRTLARTLLAASR